MCGYYVEYGTVLLGRLVYGSESSLITFLDYILNLIALDD